MVLAEFSGLIFEGSSTELDHVSLSGAVMTYASATKTYTTTGAGLTSGGSSSSVSHAIDASEDTKHGTKPDRGTAILKPNYLPKQILNGEQLDTFLEAIEQDEVWRDFFTELTTGLRRGAVCALQWDNLNPKTGELQVERQVH